jgi:hypothetical protein
MYIHLYASNYVSGQFIFSFAMSVFSSLPWLMHERRILGKQETNVYNQLEQAHFIIAYSLPLTLSVLISSRVENPPVEGDTFIGIGTRL